MSAGIQTPAELIPAEVRLTGTDGNAGALMGRVARALKKAGNEQEVIDAFRREAMSGDYDHLLQTCMTYAEVS